MVRNKKTELHIWVARLLIALVVAWNLECALVFLLNPGLFAPGFELTGIPGEVAVRGFGILFVMWNIPYLLALWNPHHHRLSLWEALAMQIVGVLGEVLIFLSIPAAHTVLRSSLMRFTIFDAAGVIALIGALLLKRINIG
jgi:hypothetical protein